MLPEEGTMDAVLFKEVDDVLGAEAIAEWDAPYPRTMRRPRSRP